MVIMIHAWSENISWDGSWKGLVGLAWLGLTYKAEWVWAAMNWL